MANAGIDVGVGKSTGSTIMCVECEDMDARILCDNCGDHFCALCFHWQHQRGNRARHTYKEISGEDGTKKRSAPLEGTTEYFLKMQREAGGTSIHAPPKKPSSASPSSVDDDAAAVMEDLGRLLDRSSWIPLRVDEEERALLHLVEGALEVSEYTDRVDVTGMYGFGGYSGRGSKQSVIEEEIESLLGYILGLSICDNQRQGVPLLENGVGKSNEEFFQKVFEVARRYKVCNPQKMRTSFGKMMWMLQDSVTYSIPNFHLRGKMQTVNLFLKEKDSLGILDDPLMYVATAEVVAAGKSREETAAEVDRKKSATLQLKAKYESARLSAKDIDRILTSVSDANSFIESNRTPVERMIYYLTTFFSPDRPEQNFSLQLSYGRGGSKLSHDHRTQFTFVHQSLVLWREIMDQMYKLWMCTEDDLLNSKNKYSLWNTGQGLNRVQSAPQVGAAMSQILSKVQREVRGWVGLSVVHLGDRDVPNAFVFIDKYLQVPRILAPVCKVIDSLPELYSQPQVKLMIDTHFGGLDSLRKTILCDYFKHGFDGSGSDGGSCIDGRLTSSWNWCSQLDNKPFGPIFMLAGFQGFDGDFRK